MAGLTPEEKAESETNRTQSLSCYALVFTSSTLNHIGGKRD